MNAKIKENINSILDNIDSEQYNRISDKLKYVDGRELVVNMIYNRLEQFPNYSFANALADVEVTLKGFQNE
jgi:hypothetical protein